MKKAFICALWSLLAVSCAFGANHAQMDPSYLAKVESLRERAQNGDVHAMHLLVEIVTEMAPRYEKEAEYWLRRAVEMGDKDAPRMLAEMLLLRNDSSGFEEAIAILKEIYEPGDYSLAGRIGSAYLDRGYIEESIGWLQLSASRGDFHSAVQLSDIYSEIEKIKSAELAAFCACKAVVMRDDHSFIVNKLRDRTKALGIVCQ